MNIAFLVLASLAYLTVAIWFFGVAKAHIIIVRHKMGALMFSWRPMQWCAWDNLEPFLVACSWPIMLPVYALWLKPDVNPWKPIFSARTPRGWFSL